MITALRATASAQNSHAQYDLSHINTMALACVADTAVTLNSEAQLDEFMACYKGESLSDNSEPPLFVLSGGSNVLLPDQLQATVLRPLISGITVIDETSESIDIEVMAGENWHDLVVYTVNNGWYGLENLALIPGLTGAAPVQNIGAYGVQLEDCLLSVRAYHMPTHSWHNLSRIDCQFGYRDSLFKRAPNTWLITRVNFRLHKDVSKVSAGYGDVQSVAQDYALLQGRSQAQPIDVMQAIVDIRKLKLPDPSVLPNCGSFFQNPIIGHDEFIALQASYPNIVGYPLADGTVKVAAGWLIEQAGLKGGGIAPIMTHQKQALVLTNHSPYKATQAEVAQAQAYIADCVYQKFAISLAREPVWVNIDGSIGSGEHGH